MIKNALHKLSKCLKGPDMGAKPLAELSDSELLSETAQMVDFLKTVDPNRDLSLLPATHAEFEWWASRIFEDFGLEDTPNNRHTLATTLMHLESTTIAKDPAFFVKTVIKSNVNAVAFEQIQRLNQAERDYHEKHMKQKSEVSEAEHPEGSPV